MEDDFMKQGTGESSSSMELANDELKLVTYASSNTRSHLLAESLLEQLCMVYHRNPQKARAVFEALRVKFELISSPSRDSQDEISIRRQFGVLIHNLIQHASVKFDPTDVQFIFSNNTISMPATLDIRLPIGINHSMFGLEDICQAQMSHYEQAFCEHVEIGAGGFASVFKVTHKLDKSDYAVKKIPVRKQHQDVWHKKLREVEALAKLKHANIVGYHTAWLGVEQIFPSNTFTEIPLTELSEERKEGLEKNDNFCDSSESDEEVDEEDDNVIFEKSKSGNSQKFVNDECTNIANVDCNVVSTHKTDSTISNVKGISRDVDLNCGLLSDVTSLNLQSKRLSRLKLNAPILSPGNFNDFGSQVFQHQINSKVSTNSRIVRVPLLKEMQLSNGFKSCATDTDVFAGVRVKSSQLIPPATVFPPKKFEAMLYIQMELCIQTLKEWIINRNTSASSYVDGACNMKILKQILLGVACIHSEGFVHRDLKPSNIFIQYTGTNNKLCVKIGDFGLTRDWHGTVVQPPANPNSYTTNHTIGVGTRVYADPEQIDSFVCDPKCDMYSVGLMSFELFSIWETELQKYTEFEDLCEKRLLPAVFESAWPDMADLVLHLTDPDMSLRPSALDLLQSKLFYSKDKRIAELEQEVTLKNKALDDLTVKNQSLCNAVHGMTKGVQKEIDKCKEICF